MARCLDRQSLVRGRSEICELDACTKLASGATLRCKKIPRMGSHPGDFWALVLRPNNPFSSDPPAMSGEVKAGFGFVEIPQQFFRRVNR